MPLYFMFNRGNLRIEIGKRIQCAGNMKRRLSAFNFDDLAKITKSNFFVIPAKAGIQYLQIVKERLDSGFHRSDDFLRHHQNCCFGIILDSNEFTYTFMKRFPISPSDRSLGASHWEVPSDKLCFFNSLC